MSETMKVYAVWGHEHVHDPGDELLSLHQSPETAIAAGELVAAANKLIRDTRPQEDGCLAYWDPPPRQPGKRGGSYHVSVQVQELRP